MQEISIIAPDDWHTHFRDGELLDETVAASARYFRRAVAMPNLTPPVLNAEDAIAYKERILNAVPKGRDFSPIVTIYLTNETSVQDIKLAKEAGVLAAKLYPSGATTNSSTAVKDVERLNPIFAAMAEQGMILLVHGEVTDSNIDIFDREKVFIEKYLKNIVSSFPELKVILEHITTSDAADFVSGSSKNVAATITPQHLLLNRNDLLVGGLRPHNYCLPVLKRQTHQEKLRKTVVSGSPKFFLGTDSAPHLRENKESACGCAGCYSAPAALELYVQVFYEMSALDKLEGFASFYGADFYGLPRNTSKVTLSKECWQVPKEIVLGNGDKIIPFWGGQGLDWKLK